MLKLRKNKKGFTLVELIVVIAIMAVLAGTITGVTVSQLNKQFNSSAQTELAGIAKDMGTFMLDYHFTDQNTNEGDAAYQIRIAFEAATAFVADVAQTQGGDNTITLQGDNTAITEVPEDKNGLPKAGEHKFNCYLTEAGENTFTVVFACAGKGTTAGVLTAQYEYSDVLAG